MSLLRRRMMMAVKKPGSNLPDYSSYRGVYIEDVDGYLYTEAEWDDSKIPNGIAVLTDNCRFVMALQDAHTSYCQWGSYGTEVTGVLTTTDSSTAKTDYRGNENTTAILNQLGNSSSTSDAPAAYYCRAFTFPNGRKGYLGAAGEWQTALDNRNAIVSALSKCGGTAMSYYYWASTQYSSNSSWFMNGYDENLYYNAKNYNLYVRAFAALKYDGEESGGGNDFGIEFPLYLTFDYCEEFFNMITCKRAADELGIKLYNCLTAISNEHGEDVHGDGSVIVVSGQILDMLGIEIYVENLKAVQVQKEEEIIFIIVNGTYDYTGVYRNGLITCEYSSL